jgi:hypothetical protein
MAIGQVPKSKRIKREALCLVPGLSKITRDLAVPKTHASGPTRRDGIRCGAVVTLGAQLGPRSRARPGYGGRLRAPPSSSLFSGRLTNAFN